MPEQCKNLLGLHYENIDQNTQVAQAVTASKLRPMNYGTRDRTVTLNHSSNLKSPKPSTRTPKNGDTKIPHLSVKTIQSQTPNPMPTEAPSTGL